MSDEPNDRPDERPIDRLTDRLIDRPFAVGLGALTLLAFAIRVVAILTISDGNPDGGDPLYYHVQANLLADGHGFAEPFTWLEHERVVPSAIHPPLFSLVLSVSSLLGGTGFLPHKITAAIVGALTAAVVGLVGRRVAGRRAGLVAAGLVAVYPNLWVVDGILMPEGVFAFTIAVVVLAAYRFIDVPRPRRAAALGVAIGVAALTRSEALLLGALVALPLALAVRREPVQRRLALLAAAGGACVLVVAPWTVRNLVRFDVPVLLSVNGDEVVRNANCDRTWHGELLGFWAFECYIGDPDPRDDEAERGRYWRDEGLDYVGDHLDRLPVVLAARVGRVWDVYRPVQNTRLSTVEGRHRGANQAGLVSYYVLVALAVPGAVVLRRRRVRLLPLLALPVMVTVTALYAYGAIRFRAPAEITLTVLAGVAVAAVRRARP